MFKFCPNCTKEAMSGWKICPYCGFKFEEVPTTVTSDTTLDDMLGNLKNLASEQQTIDKLRVMIIRGRYDEAKEICNNLIDNDPMDKVGYLGLIRIASENYKKFEGAEIDEQIRIAEEVFFDVDELLSDLEYAKYITARKQYIEKKERKRKEEEKAEAERKRKEEEKAEAERKCKEAEEAEVNRKAREAEAIRKIKELYNIKNGILLECKKKDIVNAVIPDSVTSIKENAFDDCKLLKEIEIPKSVTSIEACAFAECYSLISIIVADDNPSYKSVSGCLLTNDGKTLLKGTNRGYIHIPDGVKSIEACAFADYCELESIEIPDGVTSIGENAFSGCELLKEIEIPNSVTRIGEYAFYGCESLKEIAIPNGVTRIGEYAFYGCESLEEINIPYGVKSIGYGAFSGCRSLESIEISDSVNEIDRGAFYECCSLEEVTVPKHCVIYKGFKDSYASLNSFPEDCVIKRR